MKNLTLLWLCPALVSGSGLAVHAAESHFVPLESVMCAAALADPLIDAPTTRRSVSVNASVTTKRPLPLFMNDQKEDVLANLTRNFRENGLEVSETEFKREFSGAEAIGAYVKSVRENARDIETTMVTRGIVRDNFWTWERLLAMAIHGFIPTALTLSAGVESYAWFSGAVIPYPHILAPVSVATFLGAVYATKESFKKFAGYLGALFGQGARDRLKGKDFERAELSEAFFDIVADPARIPGDVRLETAMLAIVDESLAKLLLAPPGPDSQGPEITNYRELLNQSVALTLEASRKGTFGDFRVLRIGFQAYVEDPSHAPHLIVTAQFYRPIFRNPRHRRPGKNEESQSTVPGFVTGAVPQGL